MSWDAILMKSADPNFALPSEDAKSLPMGTVKEMKQKLAAAIPSIKWQSTSSGYGTVGPVSLEVMFLGQVDSVESALSPKRLGESDEVYTVGMSARGGGNPLEVLVPLAKANKWSLADSQSGEWIDLNAPNDKSWQEFTEFREEVVGSMRGSSLSQSSPATNLMISAVVFAVIGIVIWRFSRWASQR